MNPCCLLARARWAAHRRWISILVISLPVFVTGPAGSAMATQATCWTAADPENAIVGIPPQGHPFCDTELVPSRGIWSGMGRIHADGDEFWVASGLWVGAIVDRGSGPEASVSTSTYGIEFTETILPNDPIAQHPSFQRIRIAYTDTSDVLGSEPHTPLALKVVQTSRLEQDPGIGDYVQFEFEVTNISADVPAGGWDLEKVYVGMMVDADIGDDSSYLQIWNDDQAAFVPGWMSGLATHSNSVTGDLAYMFDDSEANPLDNVDAQVGVVTLSASAHSFQAWSGGAQDPTSDTDRYSLLRGESDDVPTIDPPTTRADDYRFLVSIGPFDRVQPRETVSATFAYVCGRLVAPSPIPPQAEAVDALSPTTAFRIVAAPNPVRLTGARGMQYVRFTHLPERATIRIYSVQGRLVKSLAGGNDGAALWDLRGGYGATVPPGTYFYRAVMPEAQTQLGKLLVLR